MERRVFVSSTVYDLEDERNHVRKVLHEHRGCVTFSTLMSEKADFPLTPTDISLRHSFDACVEAVAAAEYCILLVKQRYGAPVISYGGRAISITHREYLEAYTRRMPLFIFVDQRTWDARNALKRGLEQDFVPREHIRLFDLVDEIAHQPRSNWMYFYKGLDDIAAALKCVLFEFDDAQFVSDGDVADGTVVRVESSFRKVWHVRNSGCVNWVDRFLMEENSGVAGLIPASGRVPVPRTAPGEIAQIAVDFTAPKYPSTCYSYWKMVDASGRYCFPKKKGLYCRLNIIY